MHAFQVVLRRPNVPDSVHTRARIDAEVGDVLIIAGQPWVIVEIETPCESSGLERIICVPRKVRTLH